MRPRDGRGRRGSPIGSWAPLRPFASDVRGSPFPRCHPSCSPPAGPRPAPSAMPLAASEPPGWGLPRIPRPGGIGFPPPPPRNVLCADVRLPAAPPSGFAAARASGLRPYPERDGSLGYAAARARTRDGARWPGRFLPTFVRAPSHPPSFDNAPASRPDLGWCVLVGSVPRSRARVLFGRGTLPRLCPCSLSVVCGRARVGRSPGPGGAHALWCAARRCLVLGSRTSVCALLGSPPPLGSFPRSGVSCSAVLRCRRPDDDSSFVRSRAARLHARGMGVGRDAAATVSARERSRIRNQRRSPCLDAACLRWVRPFTRALSRPAAPPVSCPCGLPPRGGLFGVPFCPFPHRRLRRGGGRTPCGPRAPLAGVRPRPSVPTGRSCLRELSRMRCMHRVGAPPPRPIPRSSGHRSPASTRRRPARPCAPPPSPVGGGAGGDPASPEDVLPG